MKKIVRPRPRRRDGATKLTPRMRSELLSASADGLEIAQIQEDFLAEREGRKPKKIKPTYF